MAQTTLGQGGERWGYAGGFGRPRWQGGFERDLRASVIVGGGVQGPDPEPDVCSVSPGSTRKPAWQGRMRRVAAGQSRPRCGLGFPSEREESHGGSTWRG